MKSLITTLYEDEHLVVVAKPPGLRSIPDRFQTDLPNLQQLLAEQYPRVWTVHRLDRETSGVICFALDEQSHQQLSLQFEHRRVGKFYQVLVDGQLSPPSDTITFAIAPHPTKSGLMIAASKGKEARTDYRVLETFQSFSWVEAQLHTGRTHQIRVHFQAIGHPLAVDPLYGKRTELFLSEIKGRKYNLGKDQVERPILQRTSLHAARLEFTHPITNQPLAVTAPLPKDMTAVLNQLRKWASR